MLDISSIIPGTNNLEPFLDSNKLNLFIFSCLFLFFTLYTDRIIVSLRDGRKFFGVLRSFDQFGTTRMKINLILIILFAGNLLLTDVYERYYVDLEYGEEYRGVYLVRGENVVLVGELVLLKLKIIFILMFYCVIVLFC